MNAISPSMIALAADMGIPISEQETRADALLLGLRDEFRADRSYELVWRILTEIAGDEYFPSVPARWEPPDWATAGGGRPS